MKILRLLWALVAVYLVAVLVLGFLYRFVAPPSTLMLAQWGMFERIQRDSVPIEAISPHMLRAIIRAEDSKFCTHSGVDWESINKAMGENRNGKPRGASTISMQVAKNLFLVPHRSYARKALEIPIAMYLDFIWPKARMMEVYLSIAEWGEGIYGVEAAAQAYFHKSAKKLTPWEASLLAAALPNPLERPANKPSSYQVGYARRIQGDTYGANISCLK
jgi:monofunctional biosynthetic peptidoglycan transglycosylase